MLIGILGLKKRKRTPPPVCYPPANRMDDSCQGPVACTAEAEIIGTVFEECIGAVGILKHICDSVSSRMVQMNHFNSLLVFPFFKD
jgi:hypothetical protein